MPIFNTADYISLDGLYINDLVYQFISREVLPLVSISPSIFWPEVVSLYRTFAPVQEKLLDDRRELKAKVLQWHHQNPLTLPQSVDYTEKFANYLRSIEYLEPIMSSSAVSTKDLDDEITQVAAPQIVVSVADAGAVLDACNARWGSLYDAIYSSEIIPQGEGFEVTEKYNPLRGEAVARYVKSLLDRFFPLTIGQHVNVVQWLVEGGRLLALLNSGERATLINGDVFRGYRGTQANLASILLRHNGLHIEIKIDHESQRGRLDPAGVDDVFIESALTSIMDFEYASIMSDVKIKIQSYRNWLALMRGTLSAVVMKKGSAETKRINSDHHFQSLNGERIILSGRSLLMARVVGLHAKTPLVLDCNGQPMSECIFDVLITTLIGINDLQRYGLHQNSRTGSMYVVIPKLQGSHEVRYLVELFSSVESVLRIKKGTLKIGLMNETRRTLINVSNCISAAADRIFMLASNYINAAVEQVANSMAVAVAPMHNELKKSAWFGAYERHHLASAMQCGFMGHAQIAASMESWLPTVAALPSKKMSITERGVNALQVYSLSDAVVRALHFHNTEVAAVQNGMQLPQRNSLFDLLQVPADSAPERLVLEREIKQSAMNILTHAAFWIAQIAGEDQPVPKSDFLFEGKSRMLLDCQTLASWLRNNICTKLQIQAAFQEVAKTYIPLDSLDPQANLYPKNSFDNAEFRLALELVFKCAESEDGFLPEILARYRTRKEIKKESEVV